MQVRCGIISSICCTLDRSVCLSENTARFTTTLNHPPHCGFPLGRRGVFNVLILGPLLLSCWGTLPLSNDCIFLKLLDIFLTLALSGVCTRRYCSSSPPPTSTSTAGPTCNEQKKEKKKGALACILPYVPARDGPLTVTGDAFVCILKYPLCFIVASRSSIVCFALSLKAAAMDLIRDNRFSLNAAPDAV